METPPLAGPSRPRPTAPPLLCPPVPMPADASVPSPRQQLRELHEIVLSRMANEFWGEDSEIAARHRLPLEFFLRECVPADSFVNRQGAWARRHPCVDYMPRALSDLLRRCSNTIDVYLRRFVSPDFTLPLLEATHDPEESIRIAWIEGELSTPEFQHLTSSCRYFSAAERLFSYCSPAFSWENGFGCRGVLILRDNRIVEEIVLEAS